MELDELLISTGVDSLIRLVHEKQAISLSEASKTLNLPISTLEDWAHILSEESLIREETRENQTMLIREQPSRKQLDAMRESASTQWAAIRGVFAKFNAQRGSAKEDVEKFVQKTNALVKIFDAKLMMGGYFSPELQKKKEELSRIQTITEGLNLRLSMAGKLARSLENETIRLGEGLAKEEAAPSGEENKGIHTETDKRVEEYGKAEEGEECHNPGEKKIKDKYGQQGLDVYNLIDGQRTAEELMRKTGATEAKVMDMLDFMEKEGTITLEHPGKELSAEELQKRLKEQRIELDKIRAMVADINAMGMMLEKNLRLLAKERCLIALYDPTTNIKPIKLLSQIEGEHLNSAKKHYESGKYGDAILEYSKAIEINPCASNYDLRACAYIRDMEYRKAIEDCTAALALDETFRSPYHNRGLAYASLGEYGKALDDFSEFIAREPKSALGHDSRGLAYYYSGNRNMAREDFKKALELDPANPRIKEHLEMLEKKSETELVKKNEQTIEPELLVMSPGITLADVGGLAGVKELLRLEIDRILDKEKRALSRKFGLDSSGGILLYGPPGVGKSYIIEAIAGEFGCKIIKVNVADVLSKWYGTSERNIADLFEYARKNQPMVLFFDEVDSLGASRSEFSDATFRGTINQLLVEMDKTRKNKDNVLVVGATNAPWYLDPALVRSGRFNKTIFVASPDTEAREKIFQIHLSRISLKDEMDCKKLAELSEGFSGANIEFACREAALRKYSLSLRKNLELKVAMADLEEALKEIRKKKTDVERWNESIQKYGVDAESFPELLFIAREGGISGERERMFR